jgi:hypothetical protein
LLATLSFFALALCFTKLSWDTGKFTLWNAAFFLLNLLFPLLSLIGLLIAVHVPKNEINAATRVHSLLVALACCVVTVFVASWHFIGLRIWTP